MAKKQEVADRISALRREKLKLSQVEFAELLGVSQPVVSIWESAESDVIPACESYLRLASIAPYKDALWFLAQAGINRDLMLSLAGKLLKEAGQLPESDVVAVPRLIGPRETDPSAKPIPIESDLVPVPGAVGYWQVRAAAYSPIHHQAAGCPVDKKPTYDENSGHSPIHIPGTIIVLDTSSNDAADLQPFWGHNILLQTTMEVHMNAGATGPYPGLRIGQLCCAREQPHVGGSAEVVPWHPCLRPPDSEPLESPFILSPKDFHGNFFGRWMISKTTDKYRLKQKYRPDEYDQSLVYERAKEEMRLYKGNVVLGRVIKWYKPR